MGNLWKVQHRLTRLNVEASPCFQTASEDPADCAVDPPVPCAQSCFLVRMWEHENENDSTSKTSEGFFLLLFMIGRVSLIILRMGFVLEFGRDEIVKSVDLPQISQNKRCAPFLCFCWLHFRVFLLLNVVSCLVGTKKEQK